MGTVVATPAACALARMRSYAPGRGSPARTPRNALSGQSESPSPSKREASGHRAGEQGAELRAASRRRGPAENPRRRAARAVGYSPRAGRGLREPGRVVGGGAAEPRCEARARAGADVQGRPRARPMNQLRGARPGAGVTGKPRGRAEGRGLLQFPVSLRTLGTPGTHRNSLPLGLPGGERMGPCRGAGPRASAARRGPVGKEVGEAWEGKVETENGGPGTRAGAAVPAGRPPGPEQSGAKRVGSRGAKPVGSRGATCYPGLEAHPLGFPAEILWAQTSAPGKLPTVWSSEQ